MKILKAVYDELKEFFLSSKTEKGGILGKTGDVICCFFGDGKGKCGNGFYEPDVDSLNFIIEKWAKEEIEFIGLVHNHLGGCPHLSDEDKEYAHAILEAVNSDAKILFPLVINDEEFKIFWFQVNKDYIEIINVEII